jgi:hypothetical protein
MNSVLWESEAAFMYNEWIRANLGFEYQWTKQESQSKDSLYQRYLMEDTNEIYPLYIACASISGQIPKVPLRLGTTLLYVGPRSSSAMNALENLGFTNCRRT